MSPWPDQQAWLAARAAPLLKVGQGVRQEDVVPASDEVELGCTGIESGTKVDCVPEWIARLGMGSDHCAN